MITLEEVIRTYIHYDGSRQGLFTDYGGVFDGYLRHFSRELSSCNMFSPYGDKPNALTIRYRYLRSQRKREYTIYRTDENARIKGEIYRFANDKAAADKFLQLYYEDNPTYRVAHDNETGGLNTNRL